jgi:hypothetical protein
MVIRSSVIYFKGKILANVGKEGVEGICHFRWVFDDFPIHIEVLWVGFWIILFVKNIIY